MNILFFADLMLEMLLMPLNSSKMRWIFPCILDLFLSSLIFSLTSVNCSFLLSSMNAMISAIDLRMPSMSDFFFAAAAVASFLSLSSTAGASSHVSTCSLFAGATFLVSAVETVSFESIGVLTNRCGLVLGMLACCCCGIFFLHDCPFKITVALFESGNFFMIHFFTRLAFDALRCRVVPSFFDSVL